MELAAKDLMKFLFALLKQVEGKDQEQVEYQNTNSAAPVHSLWDVVSPSHVTQNASGT